MHFVGNFFLLLLTLLKACPRRSDTQNECADIRTLHPVGACLQISTWRPRNTFANGPPTHRNVNTLKQLGWIFSGCTCKKCEVSLGLTRQIKVAHEDHNHILWCQFGQFGQYLDLCCNVVCNCCRRFVLCRPQGVWRFLIFNNDSTVHALSFFGWIDWYDFLLLVCKFSWRMISFLAIEKVEWFPSVFFHERLPNFESLVHKWMWGFSSGIGNYVWTSMPSRRVPFLANTFLPKHGFCILVFSAFSCIAQNSVALRVGPRQETMLLWPKSVQCCWWKFIFADKFKQIAKAMSDAARQNIIFVAKQCAKTFVFFILGLGRSWNWDNGFSKQRIVLKHCKHVRPHQSLGTRCIVWTWVGKWHHHHQEKSAVQPFDVFSKNHSFSQNSFWDCHQSRTIGVSQNGGIWNLLVRIQNSVWQMRRTSHSHLTRCDVQTFLVPNGIFNLVAKIALFCRVRFLPGAKLRKLYVGRLTGATCLGQKHVDTVHLPFSITWCCQDFWSLPWMWEMWVQIGGVRTTLWDCDGQNFRWMWPGGFSRSIGSLRGSNLKTWKLRIVKRMKCIVEVMFWWDCKFGVFQNLDGCRLPAGLVNFHPNDWDGWPKWFWMKDKHAIFYKFTQN